MKTTVILFYKKDCVDKAIEVTTTSKETIKLIDAHRPNHRETKQEVEDFLYKVKRELDLTSDDFDWKE